ncbi:MAG: hypothetical protein JW857_00240 [Bacteroidales bacterium]|nr:hypothetical protein [Bacteroidales bacterium]
MKKSVLIFSFAFMAIAAVTFTACKNTPKATENADATEATEATDKMATVEYQCPMKCEGDKTYAEMGKCPECGMDLKALNADSTQQMAMEVYQCPMKCEGDKTYAEMGKCPECGMDLKALAVESTMQEKGHEGHNH